MLAHFYWICREGIEKEEIPKHVFLALATFRKSNPGINIVFHSNCHKTDGVGADLVVNEASRVTAAPFHPFFTNHIVDWMKLNDAARYGGMFLDCDQLFIREYPEWFRHPDKCYGGSFSGEDIEFSIGCISCNSENPFIREWLDSYTKNYRKVYNWNSCLYPAMIINDFSEDASYVEDNGMLYPFLWSDIKVLGDFPNISDFRKRVSSENACSAHFGHSFVRCPSKMRIFETLADDILQGSIPSVS